MTTSAGLILAGGMSSRMGQDKAFVPLAGRSLLDHMVERLTPQVTELAINTNGDLKTFVGCDLAILRDGEVDGGPLAGVLVGLRWATQLPSAPKFLATIPVDTPFVPDDFVSRLSSEPRERPMIAIAGSGDRDHPILALWPLALLEPLEEWRKTAKSKGIRGFLAAYGFSVVDFPMSEPGLDPFFNVNTPEDLAEAERREWARRQGTRF